MSRVDVRGSDLHSCLRAEADLGKEMASDPVNANLPPLHLRVTTLHSRWFSRRCRVCQDKFREGDQVRLCPECGDAYHDDSQYGLDCWRRRFGHGGRCKEAGGASGVRPCDFSWAGELPDDPAPGGEGGRPHAPPPPALVGQFLGGLEAVWRPFGGQKCKRVEPGSRLAGRACPMCRFPIRAGDWVVACPCGCGTYFHQDVLRHLTCWNSWNGGEGHDHCATTMRPIKDKPDA
jgi:hypothetical protein